MSATNPSTSQRSSVSLRSSMKRPSPLEHESPESSPRRQASVSFVDDAAHQRQPSESSFDDRELDGSVTSTSTTTHSALPPPRQLSFSESLAVLGGDYILAGIKDALLFPSALIVIYSSRTIQVAIVKCLVLNGILLLGSIALFHLFVSPVIKALLDSPGSISSPASAADALPASERFGAVLMTIYHIFLLYPIYLVSFVLSTFWYQEIANRSFRLQVGTPRPMAKTYESLLKMVAGEVYHAILILIVSIQTSLVYNLIPVLGPSLSFVCSAWMFSFFSFEYKWIYQGWPLEKRIDYLEKRWAYFLGFGLPGAAATFFFPTMTSQGVFAIIFPLYIIMANTATPLPPSRSNVALHWLLPKRAPFFRLATHLNQLWINRLKKGR
ncbi:etoposide-induced protein 2.4-domain-containing protein [Polychytrium aggregatum]|uniref:etoposide-induced protein 2.4-domain-containing protein n=1 Tax=Polychytrium aggregatum TaxID=110093 RepID=UPI0022FEEF10|nr:etoposide-induced protein 2.4-domain-containing protein [Polychytrium aggregatum]KAI9205879.1 etoposide-induced protein 2.4-domain-containing protein [Polychytrium aggregatum]